jgi:hypothetical protein
VQGRLTAELEPRQAPGRKSVPKHVFDEGPGSRDAPAPVIDGRRMSDMPVVPPPAELVALRALGRRIRRECPSPLGEGHTRHWEDLGDEGRICRQCVVSENRMMSPTRIPQPGLG